MALKRENPDEQVWVRELLNQFRRPIYSWNILNDLADVKWRVGAFMPDERARVSHKGCACSHQK